MFPTHTHTHTNANNLLCFRSIYEISLQFDGRGEMRDKHKLGRRYGEVRRIGTV